MSEENIETAANEKTDNRITETTQEAGRGWPDLGRVYLSCFVAENAKDDGGVSLLPLLARHKSRDWGDLDEEDKAANDSAIITGARVLSAYSWRGEKIWIITEAVGDDGRRAATTILYPSEY